MNEHNTEEKPDTVARLVRFNMSDTNALAQIMPIADGESVKDWADRAEMEGLITLSDVSQIMLLNPMVW